MDKSRKYATNQRYLDKFKSISVRIPLDTWPKIEQAAAAAGQSLQGYILQAVKDRAEKDQGRGQDGQ